MTEPFGGGPKPMETVTVINATDRMADASCKVSLKCDQIGEGKKAGVYQSCIAKQKGEASKDVAATSCPKGVDSDKLNACLDKVRTTNCDDITSALTTLDACKASALCMQ
jgi:hypothetical protein